MSAALDAPGRVRRLDPLLLAAGVLLAWAAVGSWTQGVAISGPLATFAYTGELLTTARFWDNAGASAVAFAMAFAFAIDPAKGLNVPGLPFYGAALLMAIGVFVAAGLRGNVKREAPEAA